VASLGCVALFSFVMVVGTREGAWFVVVIFMVALFTYWSLEAAHRLRSWGSWVAVWREDHTEPPVLSHATARRMGASSVVIALMAPLFMPAVGDAILSWKSGQGDGPGDGGSGGQIDPLVSINRRLVNQSDEEMFVVTTEDPSRWKLVTLERYEPGSGEWSEQTSSVGSIQDAITAGRFLPTARPVRQIRNEISVRGLRGEDLPVRFPAASVEFTEGADPDDLKAIVDTGDVALSGGLSGDEVYQVVSQVPEPNYGQLRTAEVGDPSEFPFELTDTGDSLSPEVIALRDEWVQGARTPFEQLVAIQDRFQGPQFQYSLEVGQDQLDNPPEDPLAHFLLESRTGYCQQYAASFALMSRSLGFPTRLAVGFLPGTRLGQAPAREDVPLPEGASQYSVTGNDAHAWPEVYFDGYGWIAFEPTHRDDVSTPTPTYTDPNPVSADPDVRASAGGPGGANGQDGNQGPRPAGDQGVPGSEVAQETEGEDVVSDAWKGPFARLAFVVLAIVGLFLIAVPSLKAWRIKTRYRKAGTPAGRAAAAFAEFQQEATELAAPRGRAESAPAYAQRVTSIKKIDGRAALRLASIYERAEYASDGVEANVADEARRIARTLRSALWRSAGWWERAGRLFSTSGLRSS
jgi:transglutaminase-like putative cysteine protease